MTVGGGGEHDAATVGRPRCLEHLALVAEPAAVATLALVATWLVCSVVAGRGTGTRAIPLGLAILGYALRPTRALAAGVALGVAGNLAFTVFWGTVAIQWVPTGLETIWLLGNAAACTLLARLLIKK